MRNMPESIKKMKFSILLYNNLPINDISKMIQFNHQIHTWT